MTVSTNYSRPDYDLKVSEGAVDDYDRDVILGYNEKVTTGMEPISTGGIHQMPATAQTLEVLSDSTDDASDGAGARAIELGVLDASWERQIIQVSLQGTTAVELPFPVIRVNRMVVIERGTYIKTVAEMKAMHGNITLRNKVTPAEIWASIGDEADRLNPGRSYIGALCVPAGYVGYVTSLHVVVNKTKEVDIIGWGRPYANLAGPPYIGPQVFLSYIGVSDFVDLVLQTPAGPFAECTDIVFMGASESQSVALTVYSEYILQKASSMDPTTRKLMADRRLRNALL